MSTTPRTLAKVAPVALLSLGLVALGVAPQLSARALGDDHRLRVAPVDPIDPFRGAYVQLDYPDLRVDPMRGSPLAEDGTDEVYVVLVEQDGVWVADHYTAERPDGGVFLACDDRHWQLECGIESLFLPQDEARDMEQRLAGGAVATVRIDARGNAALLSVD